MTKMLHLLAASLLAATAASAADDFSTTDTRCYEMRVYYANPGKLNDLLARFRDHTLKLFEKHGIQNIGYWIPVDNKDNKLVYLLAYPSREERETRWKAFTTDPDWKAAAKASEVNGKLVARVESTFLRATDYSPAIQPEQQSPERVFELRIYKCTPNHLPNLNARFRDHTVALFKKHGMTQIGYWLPTDPKQGAGEKLVYLLAHKSQEAAAENFKNFRADPVWIAAKDASEKAAGGSLTQLPDGVTSEFLKPTDFSPMK